MAKAVALAISLVLLSLLVVAALVEGGLRLWVPGTRIEPIYEFTPGTARWKMMKPNLRGVIYGVPFETNNVGFRDTRPWSPDKGADELRITVLGDSYTASPGVAFESLYTQVAQRTLQEGLAGRRVRVMNLGVGGYNVVQYRDVLQEVALGLKPDYIVVGVFPSNDFENTTAQESRAVALGLRPPPTDEGLRSLYMYKAFGWKLEYLARAIADAARRRRAERPPAFGPGSDGWDENTSALIRLARIAHDHGIPVLAMLLPQAGDFRLQAERHDLLTQFCVANGLECLDMLEAFVGLGKPPRAWRVNVIDRHPNEHYHQVVGRRLAEYLAARVVGPGRPSGSAAGSQRARR
jgi:lysophospholipase L1-like esterase